MDCVISHLLHLDPHHCMDLEESYIQAMVRVVQRMLLKQPALLELHGEYKICGDLHGHFEDLQRIFEIGGVPDAGNKYIFLGDYVDRGMRSLEVLCLLFAFKIKYPDSVYLLRGNHEQETQNIFMGFWHQCAKRYSAQLWKDFNKCFDCLPIAAVVNQTVFCCHGGLSPKLKDLKQIKNLKRPYYVPQCGMITDVLWSDPVQRQVLDWMENARGCGFTFTAHVVEAFLKKHKLKLICRGHQHVSTGYHFSADCGLVTLLSASNYRDDPDNRGAMLKIGEDTTRFQIVTWTKDKTSGCFMEQFNLLARNF